MFKIAQRIIKRDKETKHTQRFSSLLVSEVAAPVHCWWPVPATRTRLDQGSNKPGDNKIPQ